MADRWDQLISPSATLQSHLSSKNLHEQEYLLAITPPFFNDVRFEKGEEVEKKDECIFSPQSIRAAGVWRASRGWMEVERKG